MTGTRLGIGICTFRRSSVRETLESVRGQRADGLPPPDIIIVDNDDTDFARDLVIAAAGSDVARVLYVHRPGRNISVARNAVLDAARQRGLTHLAFIDDDETAAPDWLAALCRQMRIDNAAAVFGPVRAVYAADAPEWMVRARPHDTVPDRAADGRIRGGYSGNVLLDLGNPAISGLSFETAHGSAGGEDTVYFATALTKGAHLAFAPDAVAYEPVPGDRARLAWLLQRRLRMGRTHAVLQLSRPGRLRRVPAASVALVKVIACALGVVATVLSPARRNMWLLRGSLHAGSFLTLAGISATDGATDRTGPLFPAQNGLAGDKS